MNKVSYIVAAALLFAAIGVSWQAWDAMADVTLSATGIVALIFGALATIGLGAGLFALIVFSNRRGFDDEAGGKVRVQREAPHDEVP